MTFAPRMRIGQRLGPTPLALVATLDEIRLSVGAGRNLVLTQTAPWPNPLEADPDVADTGWVDVTAHRTGFADETKRFTVTRTRRGDIGTAGLNSALVLIYKRSASVPAVPSVTATYTFASGISGLDNGWSASPQAGTDPLYVTAATASSTAAFDTIAPAEWAGPVISVQSSLNSATVYLFQRTATNVAPALPSATVTYTFASGATSGVTNGWATSLPTTGGAYRWVTTGSALGTAATDTILAAEWAAAAVLAQDGVDGANGLPGLNNALILIYKRSASLPAVPSTTATYSFSTGISGLNNGWTISPPAGSDPLYVTSATASSTGPSDTIAPGEWAGPVIYTQDGSSGINSATVYLFQRTATNVAPALPSASVTYTFASGATSGVTSGWATSLPTTGGAYRWVTTASALGTAATDTILAAEWAAAALLAQDGVDGANGLPGLNNALILIYKRSASLPAVPSTTATYSFSTGISGLSDGWTISPPAGSDPLYVSSATASSTGPSDTIAPGEWAGPVIHTQDGASALNSATVYLFQRTATNVAPALPSAAVTYTFASGATSGVTNGWATSLPTTGGAYRWVTTASALGTAATDTILAAEWAAAAVLAQDGVDGASSAYLSLSVTSVNFTADSTGLIDPSQVFNGAVEVIRGNYGEGALWTLSVSTSDASITASLSAAVVGISSMGTSVNAGTVTVSASRTGYTTLTAAISVGKIKRSVPASGPVVSPGDLFVYAGTISPADAVATVEFRRDGTIWSSDGTPSQQGSWYLPNGTAVGDNFQVRFDQISSNSGSSSSANGQWNTLTSTRNVQLINTVNGFSYKQATVGYSVRPLGGGATVCTGLIYMNADVEQ